jgi:ABC-type polysaccharide/polyol phosphate export permease
LLALPALLLYLPLGLFIALALGPFCARFRDMPQMIASALQILFFLTPIFWMPGHLQGRLAVVDGNPFYHLVEIMRAPLMGHVPTAQNWAASLAATAFVALLATASLSIARRRVYLWL